ncbi:MAG: hypothetical protein B7Z15_14680, partial [Rhizobiales bacterium 32-66-8]
EFHQEFLTPDVLARSLSGILSDGPERRTQLEAFARLDGIFAIGAESPSLKGAREVLALGRRVTHTPSTP